MNDPSAPTSPKPPKKWKMAIIVWLSIYPLITLVLWAFGSQLAKITPLALRTLILTAILVPLMFFGALPLMQKLFAGWLRK
jgi:antibiotic biosynthesis monooxygenase (ABM) superfamily enzyme